MFNAFISYSHSADDKFAPPLQNALQKFAKPWYKKRNLEIFRDESSLSASPHLWANITKALDQSEYLILLASPLAENSHWVNEEVKYWLKHKSVDTILLVLTEGEIKWDVNNNRFLNPDNNSLPPALDNVFKDEPFYVDLRQSKTYEDLSLDNPIFKKEILKLAAKLHNKPPNELASEEVTVHRKMILVRNSVIGALGLLLVAAIILGVFANTQKNTAQNQLARSHWDASKNKSGENELTEALQFIAEGVFVGKNQDLNRSLLFDAESLLPQYFLKEIIQSESDITDVVFNDNKELVLITGIDSIVRLWNTSLAVRVGQDMKHDGPVQLAAFSTDSDRVITLSDFKIYTWEAVSGKLIESDFIDNEIGKIDVGIELIKNGIGLRGDPMYDMDFLFSPDTKSLVILVRDQSKHKSYIQLIDVKSNKQRFAVMYLDGMISSVAFDKDGKRLLAAGNDKTARLFDAKTGKQIGPSIMHSNSVRTAIFNRDGANILTYDGSLRIWDSSTGIQIGNEIKHNFPVIDVEFSTNGKWVISRTFFDGAIHIWDRKTTEKIRPRIQTIDSSHYSTLAITSRYGLVNSNGKWVLSSSFHKNVRIWSAINGNQISNELKHDEPVKAYFNSNGEKIFTITKKALRVWKSTITNHDNSYLKLETSDNTYIEHLHGNLIIASANDSIARIFNTVTKKQIGKELKLSSKLKYTPVYSDGKRIMIYNSMDSKCHFIEIKSGEEIGPGIEIDFEYAYVNINFSKDGNLILVTNYNSPARIWDIARGKRIGEDMGLGIVNAVFSPNSKFLVTEGRDDRTATIWEVASGKKKDSIKVNERWIGYGTDPSAFFTQNGKHLITASGKNINLWDVTNGSKIGFLIENRDDSFGSIKLSPDNKQLLTTTEDSGESEESTFARTWNISNGKQIGLGMRHNSSVSSAYFNPDGRRVVTESKDGKLGNYWNSSKNNDYASSVKIWDALNGKQLGPTLENSSIIGDGFINNGNQLLTMRDSIYKIWDIGADLDLPGELFKKQANVITGWELNNKTNNLNIIPNERWYSLKVEYLKEAREHYKKCKFREYNYWSRCYPEEAAQFLVDQ